MSFTAFDPQFLWLLAAAPARSAIARSLDDPAIATNPVGSGPYTLDVANTVPGTHLRAQQARGLLERRRISRSRPSPFVCCRTRPRRSTRCRPVRSTRRPCRPRSRDSSTRQVHADQQIDAQAVAYIGILDRGRRKWPALGDQRVRQAINYAIDREGILKGLYAASDMVTEQVFNPAGEVYDESLNDTYSYDPEKGKELVEEAGLRRRDLPDPEHLPHDDDRADPVAGLRRHRAQVSSGSPVPPQQAQSATAVGRVSG